MNNNSCGYPLQRQMRSSACDCGCGCQSVSMSAFPDNTALAMAYVPFQGKITETCSCDKALMTGTLFPCLDKPFLMGCCR